MRTACLMGTSRGRRLISRWIARAAVALTVAVPFWPATALAQASGDGFLFREPRLRLTLRGGFDGAIARGDIYSFVTEELTLDRRDFRGGTVGGDVAVRLSTRLDVVVGGSYSRTSARSEFRDYVGTDDLPIEQQTSLTRAPLTVGVRAYLMPRGRSVGQLAWVPARFTPYVGAGAGAMYYQFAQVGEFVDYETLDVFHEELSSAGWTPAASVAAGFDYSLAAPLSLNVEAKYGYARAPLGNDFVGFDRIDLSGLSTTVGFSLRF